jgi:hypothetical protein
MNRTHASANAAAEQRIVYALTVQRQGEEFF